MSEKWRQKLHLEPPKGWLNDPNGLCFFGGKYHVFFQYSPEKADGSAKKCWGHYESPDLLKWDYVGIPIRPDIPEDKDGVYSGSAIITDGKMELFYTGNVKESGDHDYIRSGRGANVIRISSADGRNFSPKKVMLRNSDYPEYCSCHVRDPKLWEDNGKYYMILGARTLSDEGCVLIYSSDNLDEWQFVKKLSVPDFGYMWECPDMFNIDGEQFLSISPQGLEHFDTKYQNIFSSGYFHVKNNMLNNFEEWDHGFDFYAPQTFEAPDGRRILIGWFGIGDSAYTNPTVPLGWQHCLTLPRELTVDSSGDILQNPIRELISLREENVHISNGESVKACLPFDLCGKASGEFEITLDKAVKLSYNGKIFRLEFSGEAVGSGRTARNAEIPNCKDIRIIADMSSLEIYLSGGKRVVSTRFYPENDFVSLGLKGISADIYKLKGMEVNYLAE